MAARSPLLEPSSLDELLLFRLTRLLAAAGAPVIRLCEGRYGITRREWRLIAALAQQGPMMSSALADRIHLGRGPTSKTVSELVRKGLAVRAPRPGDRRRVDIALTPAARVIYDDLFPEVVRINRLLLDGLSRAEVDGFDRLLARLQQHADAYLSTAVLPKANRHLGRHGLPAGPGTAGDT
jgi:DNA-binding MarR family transcriptional regulator